MARTELAEDPSALLLVGATVIALSARMRSEPTQAVAAMARRLGHDLRGPLLNLRMGLQLLAQAEEEEREALATSLTGELDRTERLMAALVDLARSGEPARWSCRLASIVHQAVREVPMPEGVELVLEVEDTPPAELDPDQQLQLFRHLLRNAVLAVGDRGRIRVRLRGCEARVEDSGPGVEPERVQQIFEPLVSSFPDGAGLGLTICRRIVQGHGGDIRVERSQELGGACFVVRYAGDKQDG
ncbi:MAG: HAMP domain-containing histidine kinase [Armatimonadetes bacterium]|nr:HAMP domain-containing histidine kinase [Armatimonadota bacterium]